MTVRDRCEAAIDARHLEQRRGPRQVGAVVRLARASRCATSTICERGVLPGACAVTRQQVAVAVERLAGEAARAHADARPSAARSSPGDGAGQRRRRRDCRHGAPDSARARSVEQLRGARAVERVGGEARSAAARAILEREGDDDENEQDGQQGGPVDARVQHRRAGL